MFYVPYVHTVSYLVYLFFSYCSLAVLRVEEHSLVPRLLCGGGGKNYGQFLFTSRKAAHGYTPCGTHMGGIEVENNITLTVTVCIASFEVIGELQRERLRHSRAAAFSWNGRMRGQLLQVKG